MSGLLSTLNEEAKEDILQEEINVAKEEAEGEEKQEEQEEQETDFLYYSHPSPATPGPEQEQEAASSRREEEGLVRSRLRSSGEMMWSASNSRHGSLVSLLEVPAPGAATAGAGPSSPQPARPPVHSKRRLDMADRANTVVSRLSAN